MADNADVANDLMQLRLDQQLAAARTPGLVLLSATCEDCDGEIPPERLAALASRGCVRCVECQGLAEQRGGGR